MTLSYTLRLACLLAVVCGAVYATVQFAFSLSARFLLRRLETASARTREGALYRLQVAPLLVALFVTGALCLPEYLRYEPTHETEPVGWLSILLAAAVVLWFGSAVLCGVRLTIRTLRFACACRLSGHIVGQADGPPIVALARQNPPVALIGFVHPCILISADLLETGGLQNEALRVALDHERSHAVHRDNWKLLVLSFLPRQVLQSGSSLWYEHWQQAADWAADDDAVQGDPARSFLLAEALVRTARSVRRSHPAVICTALTSAEAGLTVRIDRLVHPRPAVGATRTRFSLGITMLVLLGFTAAVLASPWIYTLSEHILHLGGS